LTETQILCNVKALRCLLALPDQVVKILISH